MIKKNRDRIDFMLKKRLRIHIGLRTIKTTLAVILSMIIVDSYGATTSKLIFAMLGAMSAVQPTLKESLESCITQTAGVLFGAVAGVLLLALPVSHLAATGIGIIMIITLYNAFRIRSSPTLACLIIVTICITPDIKPFTYALSRIWDTAIGLGVGMLINTLVFPYDNSSQIRTIVISLDKAVIRFLEEMFDGDDIIPDSKMLDSIITEMARQLSIFANQRLILHLKRQKNEIDRFRVCEGKARELLARMEVLSHMEQLGRLNDENRSRLKKCGADIRDERPLDAVLERDVITNYHIRQILKLRRELLEVLNK